jgi:deoxyribodipyrimidine photolyase
MPRKSSSNLAFDRQLLPMLTLLWFSRDLRLTDNPAQAAFQRIRKN